MHFLKMGLKYVRTELNQSSSAQYRLEKHTRKKNIWKKDNKYIIKTAEKKKTTQRRTDAKIIDDETWREVHLHTHSHCNKKWFIYGNYLFS